MATGLNRVDKATIWTATALALLRELGVHKLLINGDGDCIIKRNNGTLEHVEIPVVGKMNAEALLR